MPVYSTVVGSTGCMVPFPYLPPLEWDWLHGPISIPPPLGMGLTAWSHFHTSPPWNGIGCMVPFPYLLGMGLIAWSHFHTSPPWNGIDCIVPFPYLLGMENRGARETKLECVGGCFYCEFRAYNNNLYPVPCLINFH